MVLDVPLKRIDLWQNISRMLIDSDNGLSVLVTAFSLSSLLRDHTIRRHVLNFPCMLQVYDGPSQEVRGKLYFSIWSTWSPPMSLLSCFISKNWAAVLQQNLQCMEQLRVQVANDHFHRISPVQYRLSSNIKTVEAWINTHVCKKKVCCVSLVCVPLLTISTTSNITELLYKM